MVIPLSLYLAVFVPGVWVLLFEYGKFDFTGDDCFRGCNTWFDNGYMFCDSTLVAMDVFHTFSTLRQTRILKCMPRAQDHGGYRGCVSACASGARAQSSR